MAEREEPREGVRPRRLRSPLARELTLVLAVKLAALAVLWLVFFRGPVAGDSARLLAPAPPPAGESSP